jgi:hypothetical protein
MGKAIMGCRKKEDQWKTPGLIPLLELTLAAKPGLTLVERSTVDGVPKVRTWRNASAPPAAVPAGRFSARH